MIIVSAFENKEGKMEFCEPGVCNVIEGLYLGLKSKVLGTMSEEYDKHGTLFTIDTEEVVNKEKMTSSLFELRQTAECEQWVIEADMDEEDDNLYTLDKERFFFYFKPLTLKLELSTVYEGVSYKVFTDHVRNNVKETIKNNG